MRPTLFRGTVLVLAFFSGLAVSFSLSSPDVPPHSIPAVETACQIDSDNPPALIRYLVISVPADGEFYLGKQRLELSQIGEAVTRSLTSIPCPERVLYIKSAPTVKFETLALIIKEAKQAGIGRIEFLLDKKKQGGSSKQ